MSDNVCKANLSNMSFAELDQLIISNTDGILKVVHQHVLTKKHKADLKKVDLLKERHCDLVSQLVRNRSKSSANKKSSSEMLGQCRKIMEKIRLIEKGIPYKTVKQSQKKLILRALFWMIK